MAFNIPSQWGYGQQPPTSAPLPPWTRPVDWPVITDAANEVQFLVSDAGFLTYALKTAFTKPASQNLYIDWGDGTTDTVSTNTNTWTTHTYIQGAGTPCSRGYTTWKVRVYTDAGATITDCRNDSNSGAVLPYIANTIVNLCGVLEVYFGDGVEIVNFGSMFYVNPGLLFNILEYVKFPSDFSYNVDANAFSSTFQNAFSLGKVVMPTNTGSTPLAMANTFFSCYSLTEFTWPASGYFTAASFVFSTCQQLQSVTFPQNSDAFVNCTQLNSLFLNCRLLSRIVNFPTSLPACTNINGMFNGCSSITHITIPRLLTSAGGTVNFSSFANACPQLRQISWAGSYAGTPVKLDSCLNAFVGCTSLLAVRFPEGIDLGSVQTMFNGCRNLKSVIFSSTCTSITTMLSTFNDCFALTEVILPPTVTTSVTMQTCFQTCSSLESVTFFNGGTITSLAQTFNQCTNLKTVVMPTSLANCTTMTNTFTGCASLQTVSFPANASLVTTMASCFQNCISLESVTLPTNLSSLSTMTSVFAGCFVLNSMVFPALPAATNLAAIFQTCRSLQTVTFTTINALNTSWANAFQDCSSLISVTLPSTQQTAIIASGIGSMFLRCTNLKTINNLDKLGNPSTAATLYLDASVSFQNTWNITSSLTFNAKLSKFSAWGNASVPVGVGINKVSSVRFLNTGSGQWGLSSYQVDISVTSMSTAAIVQMFNDLAAQPAVSGKIMNITNAVGTAGLTAADRLIVTSKGWTIVG